MKIIVARTVREFNQYLKEKKLTKKDCLYVSSPWMLRGRIFKKEDVVYYGEWWEKRDIEKIKREIDGITNFYDSEPKEGKK